MSEAISWTEHARRLVAYHAEALDFVRRAIGSQQVGVTAEDAAAVSRLWLEAEQLDGMVCSLLNEMNGELLGGEAELDTTRGASPRLSMMDVQYVAYECSWSLLWGDGHGVSVNLAVDPRTRVYEAQVRGLKSGAMQGVRFPVAEANLKEALTDAYVAEATH